MFLLRSAGSSTPAASIRSRALLGLPAILVLLVGCTSSGAPPSAPSIPGSTGVAANAPALSVPALGVATLGLATLGVASDQSGPAASPPPAGVAVGAPGSVEAGGGSAASGAIAYPFPAYVGTSGVAPDHTIVVVGSGQATLKADGSNRSAAQRTAVAAAMADARALAEAAASAAGVTITGVSSISVSVGESYAGVQPMTGVPEPGTTQNAPAVPGPSTVAPELAVTVTVAYKFG